MKQGLNIGGIVQKESFSALLHYSLGVITILFSMAVSRKLAFFYEVSGASYIAALIYKEQKGSNLHAGVRNGRKCKP